MEQTQRDLIVLAGILHDIGKLLERGEVFSESRKDETCLGFCPKDRQRGYHTHLHCTHTKVFCDELEQKFDCLRSLADKEWKTWAAAHHLWDEQSFGAKVVRIADRLSSSEREEGQFYYRGISQKTLLEPVIEKVFLEKNQDKLATNFRYPLTKSSNEEDSLFPKHWKDFPGELEYSSDAHKGFSDPGKWKHMLSKDSLKNQYYSLCKDFLKDIDDLSEKCPEISLRNLTISIASILEKYTANIPSATNVRHPDISLYDHMRTTASIAQALWIEQKHRDSQLEGLESDRDPKWVLACGDFSGIQKFIYNLTNQGAAKGLRGRSYYVQMFCTLSSRYIRRRLGLNPAALLYDSGGKFYILLPACQKQELYQARQEINAWLLEKFEGSIYLGLGTAQVTGEMFFQGRMHTAWKEAAENLEKDRSRKFSEFLLSSEFFEPRTEYNPAASCPVCGSRMVSKSQKCTLCENLENLGMWLRDTEAVLTLWDNDTAEKTASLLNTRKVLSFDGLKAFVVLLNAKEMASLPYIKARDAECVFLNEAGQKSIVDLALPSSGLALQFTYVGKWNLSPGADGEDVWDFTRYAEESEGIKRLGVLRMDVDNLGLIFMQGLNFPQRSAVQAEGKDVPGWGDVIIKDQQTVRKPMASISRMTTLSRQLKNFFSGYLVYLLKQDSFDKCQIIYSGGDDLFVIGSWHQLPVLAQTIHEKFNAFCCGNPDMGLSGGITLHRGKYPIYKAAQLAGEAESRAKSLRREWLEKEKIKKSAVCFQNTPVLWEDWSLVQKIIELLNEEYKSGNKGLSSFLRQITAGNKNLVRRFTAENRLTPKQAWAEIAFYPWHWRTKYQLKRRYQDNTSKIENWGEVLFDQGKAAGIRSAREKGAVLPVFSWLELPLTIADYLHR